MYVSGQLNPLNFDTAQPVTYKFGTTTQLIAGVQKLIQRYLISLVNSGFFTALIGNAASNISEATNLFNTYNWAVIKTFKTYQTNNANPNLDEQLNTVQLISASSDGDTASFSIQLVTSAGNTVLFTLPLPL